MKSLKYFSLLYREESNVSPHGALSTSLNARDWDNKEHFLWVARAEGQSVPRGFWCAGTGYFKQPSSSLWLLSFRQLAVLRRTSTSAVTDAWRVTKEMFEGGRSWSKDSENLLKAAFRGAVLEQRLKLFLPHSQPTPLPKGLTLWERKCNHQSPSLVLALPGPWEEPQPCVPRVCVSLRVGRGECFKHRLNGCSRLLLLPACPHSSLIRRLWAFVGSNPRAPEVGMDFICSEWDIFILATVTSVCSSHWWSSWSRKSVQKLSIKTALNADIALASGSQGLWVLGWGEQHTRHEIHRVRRNLENENSVLVDACQNGNSKMYSVKEACVAVHCTLFMEIAWSEIYQESCIWQISITLLHGASQSGKGSKP